MLDNSPDKQTLSLLSVIFISRWGSSAKTNLQRLQLLYTKHLTYYTLSLQHGTYGRLKMILLYRIRRGELFYGYWAVSKTWFLRSILSHCDVKIVIHDGFSITSSWYYNPRTWVHIYYCVVQRELKEMDRWYYKCNVKAVIQHYIIILLAWRVVTAGWVLIMNCCYRRNVFHVNTF